jgi:hydrogenase nickel incorporation protein HypA/HybF
MHELAVTENLLEIAIRHGNSARAKRISHLYLVIGQLSSIVDDSVQFYWDIVSKDTIAEGALLHFQRKSIELSCENCGHQFTPIHSDMACPSCGSIQVKIISGEEFYLEAMDVET